MKTARRLALTVPLWTALLVPAALLAGDGPPPVEEVYLDRGQALEEIFPGAGRIEAAALRFDPEEKKRIEERLGSRLLEDGFEVFRVLEDGGAPAGYAVITEEIGKYHPITFIVGVTPRATVKDAAVMVYRESIGGEVKRRRFLSQFEGKKSTSPIALNRDIIHVSGATLSSRAIARGVKKVLLAVDECLIGPRRREIEWSPIDPAGGEAPGGGIEAAAAAGAAEPVRRAHYLMGTVLEATAYGETAAAEAALREAFAAVARLEDLLSTFRAESEISRVNREAAGRPVVVSADTLACVEEALAFARRTGGAFDPTLERDGHRAVAIDRDSRSIRFLREGLRLDLGGIGKGFALERAAAVLEERGVTRALLNFGGQVLALDPPPGRAAWIIPVRDPMREGEALGHYELARGSVSTSGAYERGRHIIDPRTGQPAAAALSATVCARSASAADALSTAIDVLGAGAAEEIIRAVDGGAALIVPAGGGAPVEIAGRDAPRFVRAE